MSLTRFARLLRIGRQRFWQALLGAVTLGSVALTGASPSRGQDVPLLDPSGLNAPWERRADGRILIPVLGHILAFPSCGDCVRSTYFGSSDGPGAGFGKRGPSLQEAIDHPAELRAYLKSTTRVSIGLASLWDESAAVLVNRHQLDPKFKAWNFQFILTIETKESVDDMWFAANRMEGALRSAMQQRSEADEQGFTKITGPNQALPASDYAYMLVSQQDSDLDARSLPLYAECGSILGFCRVGNTRGDLGFALRPDIRFRYVFPLKQIPISKFRETHTEMRQALESLLTANVSVEKTP